MVRVACLLLLLLLSLAGCSGPAPGARAAVAAAGAASPAGGPVRLWADAAIFTLVIGLIGASHTRVEVEMYELGRADIVAAVIAARSRGVAVRVVVDPTVDVSRASANRLRESGVAVRIYPVDDKRHQIDHVKLLIADDQAVIGGMNWGANSYRNHDFVLETGAVADVDRASAIFDQDWSLGGGRPAPLRPAVGSLAQTAPGAEIRRMIEAALVAASRTVRAEVYTLTDPAVIAELALARRRGVDVRLVLDPNQAYNLRAAAMLRAAGVGVRWYPVPRGALLHAKVGLFDGLLVLGSANWTVSGLGVNHELDIETRDAGAVGTYAARFELDWSRSAA